MQLMRIQTASLFALACFSLPLAAQAPHAVGFFDGSWVNPTVAGTPVIDARVYYPAEHPGAGTPVRPSADGWPTVVFLHGYGMHGSDYAGLGHEIAAGGFVVVMLDTARFDYVQLEKDAIAMHALLKFENEHGHELKGAIDMKNVGVVGHSMGGGVAGLVCLDDPNYPNPGYKIGLAIAPVFPGPIVGLIRTPFGVISGEGDPVTIEAQHADPFFDALHPSSGLKFHYSMGPACDHDSIVGINVVGGPVDMHVFRRAMKVSRGYLRHFLARDPIGLHEVFGTPALEDANFDEVRRQAALPQAWADSLMRIGTPTRLSFTSEDGFGAMVASLGGVATPIATVLGDLVLDPSSMFTITETIVTGQQLDVLMVLPYDASLVGLTFSLQGIGTTPSQQLRLGSPMTMTIQP